MSGRCEISITFPEKKTTWLMAYLCLLNAVDQLKLISSCVWIICKTVSHDASVSRMWFVRHQQKPQVISISLYTPYKATTNYIKITVPGPTQVHSISSEYKAIPVKSQDDLARPSENTQAENGQSSASKKKRLYSK